MTFSIRSKTTTHLTISISTSLNIETRLELLDLTINHPTLVLDTDIMILTLNRLIDNNMTIL